jgi:quinol monooxygenase YgiN
MEPTLVRTLPGRRTRARRARRTVARSASARERDAFDPVSRSIDRSDPLCDDADNDFWLRMYRSNSCHRFRKPCAGATRNPRQDPQHHRDRKEYAMSFARNVNFTLKTGKTDEFNRLMTSEILPLMKNQKGFCQDLTVLHSNSGMSITVWDDRASAETYNTKTYPEVLKKLTPVLEGTPRVETYDTIHTLVH